MKKLEVRETTMGDVTHKLQIVGRIINPRRRRGSGSPSISLGDDEAIEMEETDYLGNHRPPRSRRESRHLSDASCQRAIFKKRTCRKFVRRREKNKRLSISSADSILTPRCWCGRTYEEHDFDKNANGGNHPANNLTANPATHNDDDANHTFETYYARYSDAVEDTDAAGIIKFTIGGEAEHDYWFAEDETRYIRFDKDTPVHRLLDKLLSAEEEWNLGDPSLIVSVVGQVDGYAHGSFNGGGAGVTASLRDCLFSIFRDTPNSWVLTGGLHAGIGKYVGAVVKDINMKKNQVEERSENVSLTCIGVTNWGVVKNKEILVDPDVKRRPSPRQYDRRVTYDVEDVGYGKCVFPRAFRYEEYLDPNHTHFLLVDDGTVGRMDDAIPFQIRNKIMENSSCPSANLLFGGDIHDLDDIIHSLTKEGRTKASTSSITEEGDYKTPCIVIKGSGKAADLIALGMELLEAKRKSDNLQDYITDIVNSKAMKEMMMREFGDVKNVKWRLKKCLEAHESSLIYVYDPHEDESVNVEVLKAFHKHGRGNIMEKFEVAYLWNQIEVAKDMWEEMIEKEEKISSVKWVIKALAEGNLQFAQLFLEDACTNGDFMKQSHLRDLYLKYSTKAKKKRMQNYLVAESSVEVNGFETYMKKLAHFFTRPQEKDYDMEKQVFFTQTMEYYNPMASSAQFSDDGFSLEKKSYSQTLADLFVWCLFVGHYDIANWLMKLTRFPTAFGLMAANVLRGLIPYTDGKDEKILLETKAKEFEQYSVEVLCKCHETDPLKAKFVMVQGLEIFERTSCMELAARDKHCLEFICHTAYQSHLTDIWRRCHKKAKPTYRLVTFFSFCLFAQLVLCPFAFDHAEATMHSPTLAAILIAFGILLTFGLVLIFAVRGMKTMRKSKPAAKDFKELENLSATNDFLFSIGIECGYARSSDKQTDCLLDLKDYFRSPVAKFYLHCTSYAVYLMVYAYFLLFDTHTGFVQESPSSFEVIMYVFWFSYITQEFKQVAKNDLSAPLYQSNWRPWLTHAHSSIRLYFTSVWNWYDLILLVTTTVIFIFRVVLYASEPGPIHSNGEQYLTLAFSVVFALFLIRLLQFFLVNILLGPKLLMIAQMLTDLLYFGLFLIIFLVSFSLVSHTMLAVLHKDQERKLSLDLIANLFRRGFWNLFGETFMDEYTELAENVEPDNSTAHFTLPTYAEVSTKILIPLLQGVYMFVTVVLLLNLLIAIFTYNITKLQEKEIKLWFIHRREVIFEYFHRPALPQPFSLIINIRDFVIWVRKMIYSGPVHCCATIPKVFTCRMLCVYPDKKLLKSHLGEKILKRVERWEKMMSNSVQEAQRSVDQSDSSFAIGEIRKSIRTLTKMQLLEDVSLENLDMKSKLGGLEDMMQKMSRQVKQQQEESKKSQPARSEPCRANCSACQKLLDVDKFYFEEDGDPFFVKQKIDCNTSGLIFGVTCRKCHPTHPIVLQVMKGFSVKETPKALPSQVQPRPAITSDGNSMRINYMKKIFRDLVNETLTNPPNHFDAVDHIPSKHMKFVGIEPLNMQKKFEIPERVRFWEGKCAAAVN